MSTDVKGIFTTYVVPAGAAGAALPLAYPFLERKSALQTGATMPGSGGVLRGVGTASLVAKIVGVQKVAQNGTTALLQHCGADPKSTGSIVFSTFVGSAVVSGYYADFNKRTMQVANVAQASLNAKVAQRGLVVGREMPFLAIDPVSEKLRENYGGTLLTDTACDFVSGGMGSVTGQMQDTLLSRLQKGLPLVSESLWKGGANRALGLGIFAVGYAKVKQLFS